MPVNRKVNSAVAAARVDGEAAEDVSAGISRMPPTPTVADEEADDDRDRGEQRGRRQRQARQPAANAVSSLVSRIESCFISA